jgi:hypothetical protein
LNLTLIVTRQAARLKWPRLSPSPKLRPTTNVSGEVVSAACAVG